MEEPLIVAVIHRYHPEWIAPKDTGRTWVPCRCPFHGDDHPSAAVSYEFNAYRCLACPAKGDAVGLIKLTEEVPYSTAVRIAESLSAGSGGVLPPKPERVCGRRLFGEQGASVPGPDPRERSPVPARVRRPTF